MPRGREVRGHTNVIPVDQIFGRVNRQAGEELETRVNEVEGVADEAYRRVGGGARNDGVGGCGRHGVSVTEVSMSVQVVFVVDHLLRARGMRLPLCPLRFYSYLWMDETLPRTDAERLSLRPGVGVRRCPPFSNSTPSPAPNIAPTRLVLLARLSWPDP